MSWRLTIRESDGLVYWVENFNTEDEAVSWLTREVSMPYWDASRTYIIEQVATTNTPDRAWAELRAKRNMFLHESDYTQTADYPGNKVAWAIYRKQLRDLPENTVNPFAPVWPTKPE